jgi:Uma2 family endonuclease
MVTTTLVTAKELERLDDGYRYELIAGELIRMTPAKPKHSWVGNRFAARLTVVVEANDPGDVFDSSAGCQFAENPDTILAPDVSFIRKERVPPVAEWDDYFRVAPDLVAEVRSPSERRSHINKKLRIYLEAGVKLVLFIDPSKRIITVHQRGQDPRTLTEADDFDGGEVIPGFRLPLSDLFNRLSTENGPRRAETNGTARHS